MKKIYFKEIPEKIRDNCGVFMYEGREYLLISFFFDYIEEDGTIDPNGDSWKIIFPIHRLKDGKIIAITSNHGYEFSDGSQYIPEEFIVFDEFGELLNYSFMDFLKIERDSVMIAGYPPATKIKPALSPENLQVLGLLSHYSDIVLVPMLVIDALGEKRPNYRNVVGQNSTKETSRLQQDKKIVDISNWAY
jgi:hypothetical protein